jgi:hypothetical protein
LLALVVEVMHREPGDDHVELADLTEVVAVAVQYAHPLVGDPRAFVTVVA